MSLEIISIFRYQKKILLLQIDLNRIPNPINGNVNNTQSE